MITHFQPTLLSRSNMLYWIYTCLFRCSRRLEKLLFREESEPRKELTIEIPPPEFPWLSIAAIRGDEEVDVTDIVNNLVIAGQVVTPEWLAYATEEKDVTTWEYISSSTFEVGEITSEGLLNEVKPKTD